ncbi:9755_t:CDS:2, partial [Gigaspora margarita]
GEKEVEKLEDNNFENPYILNMILDFKGLSISIIVLYVVPTSSEVQKNIKEYFKKHLKDIETKKKAQRCVILGDFN